LSDWFYTADEVGYLLVLKAHVGLLYQLYFGNWHNS